MWVTVHGSAYVYVSVCIRTCVSGESGVTGVCDPGLVRVRYRMGIYYGISPGPVTVCVRVDDTSPETRGSAGHKSECAFSGPEVGTTQVAQDVPHPPLHLYQKRVSVGPRRERPLLQVHSPYSHNLGDGRSCPGDRVRLTQPMYPLSMSPRPFSFPTSSSRSLSAKGVLVIHRSTKGLDPVPQEPSTVPHGLYPPSYSGD